MSLNVRVNVHYQALPLALNSILNDLIILSIILFLDSSSVDPMTLIQ